MLIQYLRKTDRFIIPNHEKMGDPDRPTHIIEEQRIPFAILVAFKDSDGRVVAGYSMCCPRDIFKKKIARELAVGRATLGPWQNVGWEPNIFWPDAIKQAWPAFMNRCQKYFGECEVWAN